MGRTKPKPWTELEKEEFLKALDIHGKNWVDVAKHVRTRDRIKVKRYGEGLLHKLKKVPAMSEE